jgi:hypothetical protein
MKRFAILLVLLLVAATAVQADSKKPSNADINRQKQDVKKAREKSDAEGKDVREARQLVATRKAALDRAMTEMQSVRRRVEEELDSTPALVRARQDAESARKSLQQASEPVLAELRQREVYQQLVAERDALKQKIDAGQTAGRGDAAAKELAALTAQVREREAAAIDDNPQSRKWKAEIPELEARVKEQIRKRDTSLESDRRIAEARKSLEKAKADLADAEQQLSRELKQAASADQKLQQEQQQQRNLENKKKQQNKKNNKKTSYRRGNGKGA